MCDPRSDPRVMDGLVLVRDPAGSAVILSRDSKRAALVVGGFRGPPGISGPPGASGSPLLQVTAGINLAYPRVVAVANGLAHYPDLSKAADIQQIVGVTTHAALAGQPITIAPQRIFTEALWGWVPGPIYCSEVGGQLTQLPAAAAILEVGKAIDSKTVSILIQRAILR